MSCSTSVHHYNSTGTQYCGMETDQHHVIYAFSCAADHSAV